MPLRTIFGCTAACCLTLLCYAVPVHAQTLDWTRQLGTSRDDVSQGVSADGLGNVYISGFTSGSLGGTNAGSFDAFLAKYNASGTLAWTRQLGTSGDDRSWGVSADGLGSVYIAGETNGNLGGDHIGSNDAYVAKFSDDLPTPGDANGDGKVNGNDYLVWAGRYGDDPAVDPPGSPANGDFNNDGTVDGHDYLVWAGNYGQGPNDSLAVPEPAAYPLIIMGTAMLLSRRRKRSEVRGQGPPATSQF